MIYDVGLLFFFPDNYNEIDVVDILGKIWDLKRYGGNIGGNYIIVGVSVECEVLISVY